MRRTGRLSELQYSIRILDTAKGYYNVEVPALPGCYSGGRTPEECVANAVEAIEMHVDGLREDGLPVPQPAETIVVEVKRRSRKKRGAVRVKGR